MSDVDYELEIYRCPYCGARLKWYWNKQTTSQVYCVDKCPAGRFLMDLDDCQMVDEDEI